MAYSYLSVDRDQLFLLPPSMREWLPEGHLVWLLLDVLSRVDTSELHGQHPNDGVGRRAYDPDMLLALLVYAYCVGVRSSRQIERLCGVDVAFRVLAAGHAPDHTTIARFRQAHEKVSQQVFVDVLVVCAEAGLCKVGVVAVDGTKVAASAARKANRTREQLERLVADMFEEAERVDAEENVLFGDERGDELPNELRDPKSRKERIDAALKELERVREERAEQERRASETVRAAWAERRERARAEGRRASGRPPIELEVELAEQALADAVAQAGTGSARRRENAGYRIRKARERAERAKANAARRAEQAGPPVELRVNTTDPDSRMMKTVGGWVQGYNAQAAVNEQGVVLACGVTQDHNDMAQCVPMMARTREMLDAAGVAEPVGIMLFDAGYLSIDNLRADGPDRLIATGKDAVFDKAGEDGGDGPVARMRRRLQTDQGRDTYSKRQHTVEPVFGEMKEQRGFRRFSRRGLGAVNAEFVLAATAHNLLKLFRQQPRPA